MTGPKSPFVDCRFDRVDTDSVFLFVVFVVDDVEVVTVDACNAFVVAVDDAFDSVVGVSGDDTNSVFDAASLDLTV